jgi:hypothetical protein
MRYNVSGTLIHCLPPQNIDVFPGLITHLRKDFPVMYRLYQALHTRRDEPPTPQEIDLARGNVPVDSDAAKIYLGKVESATANIIKSLENQAKKSRVSGLY